MSLIHIGLMTLRAEDARPGTVLYLTLKINWLIIRETKRFFPKTEIRPNGNWKMGF
jgi:hypothetical protein